MNERRNYYRILHVQPDAPAEIIAASYRSLMTTLRRHPDRGGDHETAAAINQAYDVLSDPARRRAYDRRLGERLPQAQRGRAGAANPATNAQAEPERTRGRCAFCGDPVPAVVDVETRCGACASPLAPLAVLAARSGREQHGRRASTRVRKSDSARLHLARGQPPAAARLRDLSPTGLSLFTPAAVSVGSTVRVVAPDFDLVAVVVQVRRQEALRIVHARLLTGWFAARRATFVSMRV